MLIDTEQIVVLISLRISRVSPDGRFGPFRFKGCISKSQARFRVTGPSRFGNMVLLLSAAPFLLKEAGNSIKHLVDFILSVFVYQLSPSLSNFFCKRMTRKHSFLSIFFFSSFLFWFSGSFTFFSDYCT
jgi:hypothetical protein